MTSIDGYEDNDDFLGGQLNSIFEFAPEETTFESEDALSHEEELVLETDETVIAEEETIVEETDEPEPVLDDGVYGNAYEWHGDWFFQETNGYCGPTSAAIIINEYFDAGITDPEYMVNQAYEMGLTDNISQGMYMADVQKLLAANGVPCENVTSSMDDLANRLESGYGIIAFVDAGEVWGTDNDTASGDSNPDHFLVVTEIDTNTGTVTLADPGDPNGNSREIPINEFEEAWADSNYEIISTTTADPELGGAVDNPQLAIANVTGDVVIR